MSWAFSRAATVDEWRPADATDDDEASQELSGISAAWLADYADAPELLPGLLKDHALGETATTPLASRVAQLPSAEMADVDLLLACVAEGSMIGPGLTGEALLHSIVHAMGEAVRATMSRFVAWPQRALSELDDAELSALLAPPPLRVTKLLLPLVIVSEAVSRRDLGHDLSLRRLAAGPQDRAVMLQRFPAALRLLARRCRYTAVARQELAARLAEDRALLESDFQVHGRLERVQFGLGDEHYRGRTVALLRFRDGLSVVYKPRPLGLSVALEGLVRDLRSRVSIELGVYVPKGIDRGTYGWTEYLDGSAVSNDLEATYYHRLGGTAALVYHLAGTDYHTENILAVGDRPYLVDNETLFTARRRPLADLPLLRRAENGFFDESGLGTGILPALQRFPEQDDLDEGSGTDSSAYAGAGGQMTLYKVPVWRHLGTTDAQLALERVEMERSESQPRLGTDRLPLQEEDRAAAFLAGHLAMLRLLARNKSWLLGEEGLRSRFSGLPTRCVLRATSDYAILLQDALHPALLSSMPARQRHLDSLRDGAVMEPWLAPLITAEQDAMLYGDVPAFSGVTDSTSCISDAGDELTDVFVLSGMELALERVRALDETVIQRLQWFAHAAVGARQLNLVPEGVLVQYSATGRRYDTTGTAIATAVEEILSRIKGLALRVRGEFLTWGDIRPERGKTWQVLPCGSNLYSGTTGLLLVADTLSKALDGTRAGAVAAQLMHVLSDPKLPPYGSLEEGERVGLYPSDGIGPYDGLAGHLWLAATRGGTEDQSRMETLMLEHPDLSGLDVISGVSGALLTLLGVEGMQGPSALREVLIGRLATELRSRLLVGNVKDDELVWPPQETLGFAHGTAGIRSALQLANQFTGTNEYDRLVELGREHEDSFWSDSAANWRDARVVAAESAYATSWCQGSAGLILGRLVDLSCGADIDLDQLRAALIGLCATGTGNGHTLCHGDAGVADILRLAGALLDEPMYSQEARGIIGLVASDVSYGRTNSGVGSVPDLVGLMAGSAGVAYALASHLYPSDLPTLLLPAGLGRLSGSALPC